jgi:hypothetical protein
MAKKTTCPITRADFKAHAKPVTITIEGETIQVPVKFFSTGSLGWYLNRKTEIAVGGVKVPVQIGLNLTIVGSKDLPQDPAAPTPAAEPAGSAEHGSAGHGGAGHGSAEHASAEHGGAEHGGAAAQ